MGCGALTALHTNYATIKSVSNVLKNLLHIAVCWNYNLNKRVVPRQVFLSSNKKFWFHCSKCNHEFDSNLHDIKNGTKWCPFCANKKLCSIKTVNNVFKNRLNLMKDQCVGIII